ncbi:hypothetical protein HYT56_00375 [Candidatus Woesearchaeota archaeon]|nr:hypothetical protein [Candidatus Woesearchaeota archaeon]
MVQKKNSEVLKEQKEIMDKNQKTLERFSLKEKIKDITSDILSKLPTKKK